MPKRKRAEKIKPLEPMMVNLYRHIYDGSWANIKPGQLLEQDSRFEPHKNNLSRTIKAAKKRVADYQAHGTSKFLWLVWFKLTFF